MGEIMRMRDFDRDTEITIRSDDVSVGMSVNSVLKWVEPNAPPHEAMKFLLTCQAAGLNPFLSEAYLINIGGKWGTIVGKYGYLKRAQRHKNQDGELDYDGHEAGITVIEQVADPRTGAPVPGKTRGLPIEIEGKIVPPGHLLVGGWARVWRKGVGRPIKASVSLGEYFKPASATWKSMTTTMISKCALVAAIREAFAIGDSYDESEYEPVTKYRPTADGRPGPMVVQARVVDQPALPGGDPEIERLYDRNADPICPPGMVKAIEEHRVRLEQDERWLDGILMKRGYANAAAMTPNDASALIRKLESFASRADFLDAFPNGVGVRRPSAANTGAMPLDREATVNGSGSRSGAVAVLEGVAVDADDIPTAVGDGGYAGPPTGEPEDDGAIG